MIFCIDFDGTSVTHDFPEVGRDIGASSVLKELVAKGHKIILWTIRDGHNLQDAINWFYKNDIPLFGVNKNPNQDFSDSPKAYANYYIDDLALGCPLVVGDHEKPYVDWKAIKTLLKAQHLL